MPRKGKIDNVQVRRRWRDGAWVDAYIGRIKIGNKRFTSGSFCGPTA
jgi:hypothetical protein